MQTMGPSRVAMSEICLVIVLSTLVLFLYFFGQFWPILLVTDKVGTQSVAFLLSITMNSLNMKGIGAGERRINVNPDGCPNGRLSEVSSELDLSIV